MADADGSAAPMAVDKQVPADAAAAPPQPLSFNVLQLIKAGQAQHGCRYGDYQRYRRYCSARLRRLYRSLRFLHGRGKYQRKMLEPAAVTDIRHLHIPLYRAERAWGYAMELKQIEGGRHFAQKRAHLLRRMTRAARHADHLCRLCVAKADSRTALEAEAYASYLWGSVMIEREKDLDVALTKFLRAKAVYEQLGRVGSVEQQVVCRQRAEEMEPSIRFCNYKLGQATDGGTALLHLSSSAEGPAADLLQSKLEAVMEEARSKEAANLAELAWLGRKLPVLNSKTRICILRAQQLEAEVSAPGIPNERKLSLFDKIFVAYHDAKRHVRQDLVAAGGAEDVKEQLSAVDRAISCLILQRTVDRNSVLVAAARYRLSRAERQNQQGKKQQQQQQQVEGVGEEQEKEKEKEKPARAEDLVRLYDTLVQNVTDLAELTSSTRDMSAEETAFVKQLEARKTACQAARSVYVGQSFAASPGKEAEAYVVLNAALPQLQSALEGLKPYAEELKDDAVELSGLLARCRAQCCTLRAKAALEAAQQQVKVEKGVASISLAESKKEQPAEVQYLPEILNTFASVLPAVGSKAAPRIARIPPPFRAVPCRPIVLDTALNAITFPSLAGRTEGPQERKPAQGGGGGGGLFSAFWGR